MKKGEPSQGTYKTTPLTDLKEGAWYAGMRCQNCGKQIAIAETDGARPLQLGGHGHFRLNCPYCGKDRLYTAHEVQRFRPHE